MFLAPMFTAVTGAVSAAATAATGAASAIGTVASIGSTLVSALGSMSQGNAAAASYRSQAQAAQYNATIQKMNADQISDEYAARENDLRLQQAEFAGRQRAALAESGIGIDSATAQDIMQEDTVKARLDDLTLAYEGQTKRTALLNDASLDKYQGQVVSMNAGQSRQAGYIGALGDVLGGVGRYYGNIAKINP